MYNFKPNSNERFTFLYLQKCFAQKDGYSLNSFVFLLFFASDFQPLQCTGISQNVSSLSFQEYTSVQHRVLHSGGQGRRTSGIRWGWAGVACGGCEALAGHPAHWAHPRHGHGRHPHGARARRVHWGHRDRHPEVGGEPGHGGPHPRGVVGGHWGAQRVCPHAAHVGAEWAEGFVEGREKVHHGTSLLLWLCWQFSVSCLYSIFLHC